MLSSFRSFMKSRVGVVVALLFLALIAIAFAAADVSGSRTFGGVAGGDRVATVGDRRITSADLGQGAKNALEEAKEQNPRLSMQAFVASGGLTDVIDQMIDRAALTVFGKDHGVVASDRLIDSEIAKIGAFRGPDGKFSEAAYKGALRQRGLNEAMIRQDIADGLIARQLLVPAAFGARVPAEMVNRYAALLTETRTGAIALVPSAAFAPQGEPGAQELAAYYAANQKNYIRPERRIIRYAVFDDSAIKSAAPTDAEIAARYNQDRAKYAASEARTITQLVLPSQALAQAALADVNGGKSLEAVAAARKLATATSPALDRAGLSAQTSDALAAAAFSAERGKVVGPVRGGVGFSLVRVDAVQQRAGKTLEQARGEIAAALTEQKRRTALSDYTARIEEEFDNGGSLGDVAKELGIAIQTSVPLTADGRIYGKPDAGPADLAKVVPAAFAMEREGQPQVAEIQAGHRFIVFDVAKITPSAAAPIAEIRADVMADLILQKGAAAAKAAAEKVQAAARKGGDLSAALASLGKPGLPPVDKLSINRQDFARQNRQVPPPLALMFSMAQGTVKVLAGPRNQGWFVVSLSKIDPGKPAEIAPMLPAATRELSAIAGREYAEQLRKAIRSEVGAKLNQPAIDAVSRQLTGAN